LLASLGNNVNRIDRANLQADIAPGTEWILYHMVVIRIHRDGVSWTVLGAARTTKTGVGDVVADQRDAFF
jgi:hypothetical protein